MAQGVAPVYFTDENTLGLGKLLRRSGREDVLYPGLEELPEVPRGADDQDWLAVIGALGFIVLSRDRRIRSRPAELRAYLEHGVRSVWIGAKQDLSPDRQMEIFLQHEERLKREIIKRGPGPWALAMSPSGVRPLPLRPNPGEKPGVTDTAPPKKPGPARTRLLDRVEVKSAASIDDLIDDTRGDW